MLSRNICRIRGFPGVLAASGSSSTFQFNYLRSSSSQSTGNDSNRNSDHWQTLKIGGALVLAGTAIVSWNKSRKHTLFAATKEPESRGFASGKALPNLPVYKSSDVGEHYDSSKRIWVSFERGVYDITDFVNIHPGGNRILMAAGGSLEPFWELYKDVHQKQDVMDILEKYRIGNLAEEDLFKVDITTDSFKGEPPRHPAFLKRSVKPFNGETPPYLLTEKFHTTNELFYVRNHLPVPEVDAKSFKLEIEGINIPKLKSLSLAELKKYPKTEISATVQCGGNRRSDMGKVKPVAGLAWSGGAIGNAVWGGVRLRDVLKSAGFKPENYSNPEQMHIQFEGLDSDPSGESYGASVPLSYILDSNFDAILAYEMNGKPLPLDHGFPLRIILPGIVGARSVKWVTRIIISDKESSSPWQQRDYKVFSPSTTMDTVDFSKAPAIMDTPPNSYICSHDDGEVIQRGLIILKGWAFSGGGRDIVRVELSTDQGRSWVDAKLKPKESNKSTKNWSWTLWEAPLDLQSKGEVEIWVKAVDNGYNQQPEEFRNVWNYRGLLAAAYHKIKLKIQ